MKPFILRFIEERIEKETGSSAALNLAQIQAGTQTMTEVARETADRDPRAAGYCLIPTQT